MCQHICLDRQGRIYFSDPRYIGHEPRKLKHRAVYRIDLDGSTHEATHEVSKPNGVVISPDGKHLYATTDDENGISIFSRNASTGDLTLLSDTFI